MNSRALNNSQITTLLSSAVELLNFFLPTNKINPDPVIAKLSESRSTRQNQEQRPDIEGVNFTTLNVFNQFMPVNIGSHNKSATCICETITYQSVAINNQMENR